MADYPSPRAAVLRTKEYHPPLGARDGVRLDFNENTFACSPKVLEVLGGISRGDLTKYPEREPVERLVASHLGLHAGQVLLTNGVDEAIHVLCQTFLEAGDEFLLPVPTYSMYEVYGSSTDAKLVCVQAGEDFAFPLEGLLQKITPATKLIAIANPNSPTGRAVPREAILKVIESAPHAMVLVDEAYFHFYGHTVLDLIDHIPNLVVTRTFSKAYGLAGLRLGMLAAHESQMHWMRRVISPYSVNGLALACLPAAIEDATYLEWYVEEVLQGRDLLIKAFQQRSLRYWPSEANFLLVKIGAKHKQFVSAMRQRDVLVRDRSNDPGCDGCVRITVGTLEHINRGIRALDESLAEIRWSPNED
ncbi:histidinol-phosphate transaminase [Alloacidobacterium dinghuense]|uniref:Histidinol-phosphate aminotransferase n=1 Tax=Alloacidobacterium dinghuense TaxID=2763107 RepID=A0A7G8BEU3_9BACT|nr:histidinol-phosphate transaminase [Alloacidobacterium dinghuense]QNI31063.1 histidinol-phosphate transaminase [Alloacidobacterium dinghuense]